MKNPYQKVGGVKPRRNVFDLSYRNNTTCDMGQLIPIQIDEVVPGDHFKMSCELVIRMQPLAAPIMHEIFAHVHTFFVPTRIIWADWEAFIKQDSVFDPEADLSPGTPTNPILLPRIVPQSGQRPGAAIYNNTKGSLKKPALRNGSNTTSGYDTFNSIQPWLNNDPQPGREYRYHARSIGTLWDYFGFPVFRQGIPSIYEAGNASDSRSIANPLDFPWRCYNMVYNEYYRDQDLQEEVSLWNHRVLNRNWRKDYFTSARPFRQKGHTPGLPVNFFSVADAGAGLELTPGFLNLGLSGINNGNFGPQVPVSPYITGGTDMQVINRGSSQGPVNNNTRIGVQVATGISVPPPGTADEPNSTNGVATFDIGNLRMATFLQLWQERNARAGTRYTELLRSHYGVAPTDQRLDRPEYIGGIKMPVVVTEVLQTSESNESTNNALGQMAGHGLSADSQFIGSYSVQEFGYIISLLSVMPKPSYQDGYNRQWLRQLPFDFYWPEFARLSEQAIFQCEIQAVPWISSIRNVGVTPRSTDFQIFGFCGQYDEMRVKHDIVTSEMRKLDRYNNVVGSGLPGTANPDPQLSWWNMTRKFAYGNAEPGSLEAAPYLNTEFITCSPRKDIYMVPSKPGLIVNAFNKIRATRPLPLIAEPGLLDHTYQ